jgi:hypothetical protein
MFRPHRGIVRLVFGRCLADAAPALLADAITQG